MFAGVGVPEEMSMFAGAGRLTLGRLYASEGARSESRGKNPERGASEGARGESRGKNPEHEASEGVRSESR